MTRFHTVLALIALTITTSGPALSQTLSREKEIEFNARHAAYTVEQMQKQESAIAAIPRKDVAVAAAAAGINRVGAHYRESGKYTQQQFTYILSVALYRLAHLAQTANMPLKVVACHMDEARSLESASKGQAPAMANCRTDAYGPNMQSEGLIEVAKPTWKPNHEVITQWVVNAFSYAQAIGKVTDYGNAK